MMPLGVGADVHAHHEQSMIGGSLATTLAAVGVHTLAMLIVTAAAALLVYEWIGVAILRRAWINFDLVWTVALIAAGVVLMIV